MFGPFSESVGEILQVVGRGFLLLNWARGSFPHKNIMCNFISHLLISAAISVLDELQTHLSEQGRSLFSEAVENLPAKFTPSCVCVLSNLTSGIRAGSPLKANTLRDPIFGGRTA